MICGIQQFISALGRVSDLDFQNSSAKMMKIAPDRFVQVCSKYVSKIFSLEIQKINLIN